ncbi:MAG: BadF/BadG/BcrA/BcrD ATPase family protein [Anaerolineae bacterium]|nr:BadF/BadG/BcrA/BcrD ATPase family protein [Anaerolineae bacterium]
MSGYYLGIDIGGTKSQALIADETGQAVGFGQGGPGNHEDVGYEGLAATLVEITEQALNQAGISKDQLAGAGYGVAGYDWPSQRVPTLAAIETLGLDVPLEMVNDTIIGLVAGASAGWGVGVVAGTRCNAWGWDRQRRVGRMTGGGLRMGEAAGGYELVDKAIEMVARAWTRLGPPTRLTEKFIECVKADNAADLVEGLMLERYQLDAGAAPLVFETAVQGDFVATQLVLWAGRELGSLANGVIHQLGLESLTFEIVLIGSFYRGSPLLVEAMRQTIQTVAPGAHLIELTVPPVLGGVLLGLEQAGVDPFPLRRRLIESTLKLSKGAKNQYLNRRHE